MTASPDCELVSAYAREGSEAAFRALVARHVDLVYGTAIRQVGDPGLAEEISQNVFVVLARKAPRLGGNQTLAGWLHRTTILEAKARIRAELRRKRRDQAAAELALSQSEGASASDALVPLLDEGLLNLREADRLALVLRFLEDQSLRDVGAALGVDEDAARKRVSRAIEKLAEFFKKRGFASTGVAAATLSAVSAKASAPAALSVSIGNAAITTGGTAGGINLFLFHLMSLTKTQTAVICAVVAATPLAFQWQSQARVSREQRDTAAQIEAMNSSMAAMDGQIRDARQSILRTQTETFNLQASLTSRRDQLEGRRAQPAYRWDDNSPLMRVPKELVSLLPLPAFGDRHGQLSEQIQEMLQMSPDEAAQVQAAIDQFLRDYYAAQLANLKTVPPTTEELSGRSAEEVVVFELTALGPKMNDLRREMLSKLEFVLGPERFPLFKKALQQVIPMDDEYRGLNTGTIVFNEDRRECFYQPQPGSRTILWRYGSKNISGWMQASIHPSDIPPLFQSQLRDWIAIANSNPAENDGGVR